MIIEIEKEILKTDYLIGRTIATTDDDPKIGMIWKLSNDRRPEECVITFVDMNGDIHEIIASDGVLVR